MNTFLILHTNLTWMLRKCGKSGINVVWKNKLISYILITRGFCRQKESPWWGLISRCGGWGRNRTGVHGFAIRCITTLLPSLRNYKSLKWGSKEFGAGNEIRTRDPNLGKVVLYHWAIPALWAGIIVGFFTGSSDVWIILLICCFLKIFILSDACAHRAIS